MLTDEQKEIRKVLAARIMKAARHLNPSRMAHVAHRFTSGVSYTGSTKGMIAESLAAKLTGDYRSFHEPDEAQVLRVLRMLIERENTKGQRGRLERLDAESRPTETKPAAIFNVEEKVYVVKNTIPERRAGDYLLIFLRGEKTLAFGLSVNDAARAQGAGAHYIGDHDAKHLIDKIED